MSQVIAKTKPNGTKPAMPTAAPENEFLAYARMIEAVATNPNLDVDKLDRLLHMREGMIARNNELLFNAALAKVQSEVPTVVCDKWNTHTKSMYPSLEAVGTAIKPICLANGFTGTFSEGPPVDGRIHVIYTVRHVGGHTETFERFATADTTGPSGTRNKTEVQGSQSTFSFLTRRLYLSTWGVTVAEDDKDGNGPETATATVDARQLAELQRLFVAVGQNEKRFFDNFKISTLAELPATSYADAVSGLKIKLSNLKKAVA